MTDSHRAAGVFRFCSPFNL